MLEALQQSAFSQWMLGSTSIWAYPTILTLHTFGMMVLAGAAMVIDLRLLGFARAIPLTSMRQLFTVIWGALIVNAVTGSMLFAADAPKRAVQPLFLLKLVLIAFGIWTLVIIKRRMDGAPGSADGGMRMVAAASLLLWSFAITAGRLLAYVG